MCFLFFVFLRDNLPGAVDNPQTTLATVFMRLQVADKVPTLGYIIILSFCGVVSHISNLLLYMSKLLTVSVTFQAPVPLRALFYHRYFFLNKISQSIKLYK